MENVYRLSLQKRCTNLNQGRSEHFTETDAYSHIRTMYNHIIIFQRRVMRHDIYLLCTEAPTVTIVRSLSREAEFEVAMDGKKFTVKRINLKVCRE